MSGRLAGKVAIITGGASGMGRATVEKFVAEGARVVVADIQRDKGEALARELGDAVRFVSVDVCNEDEIRTMIGTATSAFGRLDCLFNNAGFGGVSGAAHETDLGEPYRRTVDAMLTAVLAAVKHAAPILRAQKSGSIISTASVAGLRGGYGPHVYSAVKAGVVNLTRSLALELGNDNVRVNAICPGGIATPIFAGQLAIQSGGNRDYASAVRPLLARMQPIPRAGEPIDIANAACFLASDESSFITGHALVVDGGLTAGAWMPPEMGGGLIEMLQQALGIEPGQAIDAVYHAR
jgi:NAD(P)-dependent dehydrogenase (short-subunit alcohol dehydrogenase family)